MKKNVTRPFEALHTDSSPQDQPKNTYRYGLNIVTETMEGDQNFRSNENSNEECGQLTTGYVPIGKVYMGNGETAIFSVKEDNTDSEIGIHSNSCDYVAVVNADLGFKLNKQIDATFRLRRGCERVIYFTDGQNKPRIFNFEAVEDYQDNLGNWVPEKFNLFKSYSSIPEFDKIEVLLNGSLPAGSYNFAIQYLDEDLNPTEWIITTDTVIIYHDDKNSKGFAEIQGSTNVVDSYRSFGNTNKAIKLTLENLDTNFLFYRIAFIQANSGTGLVNEVSFSSEISTKISTFTYTGTNAVTAGTEEEVQTFMFSVDKAEHIEQIENRLVLLNVEGKQVEFCKLQKYASRVQADLALETIILNDATLENNPKRQLAHVEKIGYMPGEIYSFGIVYVFADGTLSPVYHIPGSNASYNTQLSHDNELTDTFYLDTNNCGLIDYWNVDGQGDSLEGELVRHHRFPLRSEINEPLLTKDGSTETVISNVLFIDIEGEIDAGVTVDSFQYRVNFTVDGVPDTETNTIDVDSYDSDAGIFNIQIVSSVDDVVFVSVEELNESAMWVDPSTYSTLTYTARIEQVETVIDNSVYSSRIMGITFSNIDKPSIEDTTGEEIIGYYIVRNERTESEKTIVDTGVITPLLEEERAGVSKFVAYGHLMPSGDNIKEDIFGLIHPEHKFHGKEYSDVTEFIKEGVYVRQTKHLAEGDVQDVMPGTSYDSSVNKRRERDSDGFDLHILARTNDVNYVRQEEVLAEQADIASIFYLDALYSKSVTDINTDRKEVFNLGSDNKIGIIQLNKTLDTEDLKTELPYVIMKRDLANPYGSFQVSKYYKETDNLQAFATDEDNTVTIYNGDSYISSMRYMSSMFYDVRVKSRRTKKGVLNFILGALAIIAGIILTATGIGAAVGLPLIALGFGAAQIAAGLKKSQMARVYQDLYEQGLKDTINDADTDAVFAPNPIDDEVQWFYDNINELWFESNVNLNWRMGFTIGLTTFLDSPLSYDEASTISYCIEKVTTLDPAADGGRTYQGYAKPEIYDINLDYLRRDKQKIYYHLALEYDCCSECLEQFPQRVHYSEQAFQEELTDNYRTFLPNNYADIEGQTGVITDSFRIQNNLYIHTEEALWHLPQNIQERITGDIISFLGTGEYFSIPPRKIVDDDSGNSAGTRHKWATIKTPYGVYFVSEHQRAIYHFDGGKLTPVSANGEYNWFKNNLPIVYDEEYYNIAKETYPYANNPSNRYGTGFISVYDSRKERVIFSKRDYLFEEGTIDSEDYVICYDDGQLVVFEDYNDIITTQAGLGWTFIGIEDCEMVFERPGTESQDVEIISVVPNNTDIHVFLDTSGSFGSLVEPCLTSISDAIDDWLLDFAALNPDWTGSLYTYADNTERWINYAQVISSTTYSGEDLSEKDIIVVSFCNEAHPVYHVNSYNTPISAPTASYNTDYANFLTLHAQYNSFRGILYPIVFGEDAGPCGSGGGSLPSSKENLLHSIAAVFGEEMTAIEVGQELSIPNPGFTATEWEDLKTALQTANPYPDDGLNNYGWVGKWDRAADEDGNVITSEQFNMDITELLGALIETEIVSVEFPTIEQMTIGGTPLVDPVTIDYSWTKSLTIKKQAWIGYHSYLPNFYFQTPERFYSWIQDDISLWKHNMPHNYQTYYGTFYDYVIEYVVLSNPLNTVITDAIRLLTDAKRFDSAKEDYIDFRYITFNKLIAYNSRQCTGELTLLVKDDNINKADYLTQQITNSLQSIIIDRNERDWTLNDLRDVVINESLPMFIKNKTDLQTDYYTDKILNPAAINYSKDWFDMEPMKDKYLIVRLIFNNFDNIKLVLNYSIEDEVLVER